MRGALRGAIIGAGLWTALIACFLAMAGCSTEVVKPVCPSLVAYTKADQAALAAEVSAADRPQTARWLSDYVGLRDQVRACQKGG